ncbi:MAG: hypothetical protein LBV38_06610 [Alistipes sp.]|jgi:hypothetical protein|nr:hypothetical protein [Alistipes sp.]
MSNQTSNDFQSRLTEAQGFTGSTPEEISKSLELSREKVRGIIDEIKNIPENERDYELNIVLVKAYVHVNNIIDAMVALVDLSVSDKERCDNDPLWNYYMGHCLLSHPKKPKYDTAYNYFVKFLELAEEKQFDDEFLVASAQAMVRNIPMMYGV